MTELGFYEMLLGPEDAPCPDPGWGPGRAFGPEGPRDCPPSAMSQEPNLAMNHESQAEYNANNSQKMRVIERK